MKFGLFRIIISRVYCHFSLLGIDWNFVINLTITLMSLTQKDRGKRKWNEIKIFVMDKWWVHCNALLICIYINKALISQSVTQIFHPWVTQLLLRGKLMFRPWVTFIQSFEGTCKDRYSVMRNLCNQFWCFKPQSTKFDDLV